MTTTTVILAVVCIITAAISLFAAYKAFGIDTVRKWLLWAVTEAESEFGSGTGKLKLAKVYDMFVTRFPKFQLVISYRLFSKLVDKALVEMRKMLDGNNRIMNIINKNK